MNKLFLSEHNGRIKVRKFLWETSVWVGGFQQSGPLVRDVWQKALNNLTVQQFNNILVLGLGCGVAAKLLIKKFPQAKITGVEIDPVMIAIGKKYFNFENARVVNADAFQFRAKSKFDLIICDLYCGNDIPQKLFSGIFLSKLDQWLEKNGSIVFNFLKPQYGNFERTKFLDKIGEKFIVQKRVDADYNEVYFCSRRE
jgi:spermidine synthase